MNCFRALIRKHLYLSQFSEHTITSLWSYFRHQSELDVLSELVLPAALSLFAVKQFVFSTIIIFTVEKIFFCSSDRGRQLAVISSCVVLFFSQQVMKLIFTVVFLPLHLEFFLLFSPTSLSLIFPSVLSVLIVIT